MNFLLNPSKASKYNKKNKKIEGKIKIKARFNGKCTKKFKLITFFMERAKNLQKNRQKVLMSLESLSEFSIFFLNSYYFGVCKSPSITQQIK